MLRWVSPLLGRFVGITNAGDLVVGWVACLPAECDFEAEAKVGKSFEPFFRTDHGLAIPLVHRRLQRPRILTMDFVSGVSYQRFREAATRKKNRAGATLFEFPPTANRYGLLTPIPRELPLPGRTRVFLFHRFRFRQTLAAVVHRAVETTKASPE